MNEQDEQAIMWEEYRKVRTEKKKQNKEMSLQMLIDKGIKYEILNKENYHCRIGAFDFWPTTGKFYNRHTGQTGRGVKNLIKTIWNTEFKNSKVAQR